MAGFNVDDKTYKTVTHLSHVFETTRKDIVEKMVEFVGEREDEFAREAFE